MSNPIDNHPIARLLVKRSRLQPSAPVQSPLEPATKRLRKESHNTRLSGMQNCMELCSILLEKVGVDPRVSDTAVLHQTISKEYSPRVLELLVDITTALDTDRVLYAHSDVTNSSDHEEETDAVVPSFRDVSPPAVASTEAVVPQLPVELRRATEYPTKQLPATPPQSCTVPSYNKDTEIAISRIFNLGNVAAVQDRTIHPDAPYHGPSVITMTGFGELGRFGNQVLQYMFLKSYAIRHNIEEIQVPAWVGASLFGLNDSPVQRAFPPAVEFRQTMANSTFTTDFLDFVCNSHPKRVVPELFPQTLGSDEPNQPVAHRNMDIWGWFQWHTSHYAHYKSAIQLTFEPVPSLREHLTAIFESELRFKDGQRRTVVGLHLRLGDYKNIAASSFGYCAPTAWYLQWLEKIWPTLDNPVLFVASDDVDAVLKDFAAYSPITGDSIRMQMPADMKEMKAGFFPDWFSLTLCDVLAISNSTFSFSACMMNRQPQARFFRAHYGGNMLPFDPWNSDPIVHRDMSKRGMSAALETLQVVYNTQGPGGIAKNLLYELPYYGLRSAIMKAVLWRQAQKKASALPVA